MVRKIFSCFFHAVDRKKAEIFIRLKKPRAAAKYIYAEMTLEKIIKNLESSVRMALFPSNLLSEIDLSIQYRLH